MAERRKPSKDTKVYKVVFFSQGQVYEVYAKSVSQGGLFGFVEVESGDPALRTFERAGGATGA